MRFGYREACLRHDTGARHPETADRLRAIKRGLAKEHGVVYDEGTPAEVGEVTAVHDADYVESVEAFCADGGGTWDADTVAVGATWDAALASAGLSRWAAEAALDGRDGRETPFAVGRPPGHHAEYDDAMGFCFFNNVAVAAEAALARDDVDGVAVFDWDVHHGNGTQDIFYDDDRVFYASVHERGLFPGTGNLKETGTGDAVGTTLNVPFPGGCGDAEYLAAVDEAVAPATRRFDPDLVLVSAGFDAHRKDPISRQRVSTEGYGVLAERMTELADACDASLAFVLEGGYGLEALAESVRKVNSVFDGYTPAPVEGEPNDRAASVLADVREVHDL
ncbi:histone deacetylase family protein [Halosegnis marinus]|uniref:Histone deacetylase family protein n=1 Tax=Halosegnis marinus TaxID=3034023 RepID=A0ABD5ZPI5_9EURY|nr:histone deacetylase [Halosegnis sp. DT85]